MEDTFDFGHLVQDDTNVYLRHITAQLLQCINEVENVRKTEAMIAKNIAKAENKKRQRMERNRMSAQSSRDRAKRRFNELLQENTLLRAENKRQAAIIAENKRQALPSSVILRHSTCEQDGRVN